MYQEISLGKTSKYRCLLVSIPLVIAISSSDFLATLLMDANMFLKLVLQMTNPRNRALEIIQLHNLI